MSFPVLAESRPAIEEDEPFSSYAYSYPHKSSYRRLDPPIPLAEVWRNEDLRHAALYVHLPFCEMRCGFCNLFTQSQPEQDFVAVYLETLARQMRIVRDATGPARIEQFAVGGGTPTFLSPSQLTDLFRGIEATYEVSLRTIPTSIETSPLTATDDRLAVLAEFGMERVSIGIQSLDEADLRRLGRPQQLHEAHRALSAIRGAGFRVLNVDLIYGDPEQTLGSWQTSLSEVLAYSPEEVFLYPLYIRPQTGLARIGRPPAEHRRDLYRAGRQRLLERGYRQTSLRCFRLPRDNGGSATYSCQGDGMIGLGCGARSYTRSLHYGTRFAVRREGVQAILGDWVRQTDAELGLATHGVWLTADEQRRRFLILGLLQAEGLSRGLFESRFGETLDQVFPELDDLRERGWLERIGETAASDDRLLLTEAGIENSDVIGPMLYSPEVRERLKEFTRQ
jgi:oxygen-independent coproporphyrinogen-3 oxidase